ncbi:hypothetical protein ACNKHK_16250 [Shigella flexneri]
MFCAAFDALAIRELRLSDGTSREGVLYEIEDVFTIRPRRRAASSLANQYNIAVNRPARTGNDDANVRQWPQRAQTRRPSTGSVLRSAAMLHEVG